MTQQKHATLEQIRGSILGASPEGVEQRRGGLTELRFAGGLVLRVGPCHRPAVRALRSALAARGSVYLAQASDHGRCWGLYFVGPDGRLPLIALDVRLVRDGGGADAGGLPAPPASPERLPALV